MVVLAPMAKRPRQSPLTSAIARSASTANAPSRCAYPSRSCPAAVSFTPWVIGDNKGQT